MLVKLTKEYLNQQKLKKKRESFQLQRGEITTLVYPNPNFKNVKTDIGFHQR